MTAPDQSMSTPASEHQAAEGTRITVALISKAADDLAALQEQTSMSKTDIANRAISLYRFVEAQLREGRDLVVRDPRTGEAQLVRLL